VPKTIIITGASSGFGAMTARVLAEAGHVVYAGMRDVAGSDREAAQELHEYGATSRLALNAVPMDVTDDRLFRAAVDRIIAERGHLDVVVHNAGHMVLGPTEAFTVEQLASVYDVNTLSTRRLNRAALPHMRKRRDGLLIWVGSSSSRGGTPPYLGPYFAAKAAEDALAVSYAAAVARFGIDTTIVVPGAFTTGTNHYRDAGHPADEATAAAYDELYAGLMEELPARQADITPAGDSDPGEVARQILRVVNRPKGQRPFRVHIDPVHDGAEEIFAIGDRVREWYFQRLGLDDLLRPAGSDQ
jgi:NAD(P)-dependent dehydrogenase (short-subunit alcohol dehydrogenase family)